VLSGLSILFWLADYFSLSVFLTEFPWLSTLGGVSLALTEYGLVYFFTLKKNKLFTTVLSQLALSHGKFGLPSPRKASCNRVTLPKLWCTLGILVFLTWTTGSLTCAQM
uniref:hypothetical protein n=1 Tax=Thiolapillus sp. TaxID=2017437 RepID=UPI003AF6B331